MPSDSFHDRPFDEATLTKLRIFELYTREWLPVFLSKNNPQFDRLHIYDFFAGSGTDSSGNSGSPIRLLRQLTAYRHLPGWSSLKIVVHFYDQSSDKIAKLESAVAPWKLQLPDVVFNVKPLEFERAFNLATPFLNDSSSAKLVLLDQFGVDIITTDVFNKLISFPSCDFLFFLASSILYRFFEHPAIKQKVIKPADYNSCHRAAFDYYKSLIPSGKTYFLAPFSIKKGSNIYGLIFGSAHPLGMSKFLAVAWRNDEVYGEANFDIDRQEILPGQTLLLLDNEPSVRKLAIFESELETKLRLKQIPDELEIMKLCFEHGVMPQHARNVLSKLKKEKVIDLKFQVPDAKRWRKPRVINFR